MVKILAVLLAIVIVMGCQKTEQQKSNIETASTVIEVKTIKCESCASKITKALENVDGVKKVLVDLDKKTANVEYVSAKTTLATLETAIAEAGYNANGTKRNDVAYQALDKCCQ